jgi:Mn2+/Fe2+ NRAMP family transporter
MLVASFLVAKYVLPPILAEMGEDLFFVWFIIFGLVVGVGATQISNKMVRQRTSWGKSVRESAIRTIVYWAIMIVSAVVILVFMSLPTGFFF